MSRILVTGHTGQVGGEVVEVATAAGHEVVGLSPSAAERCDIVDGEAVRRRIEGWGPDLVVHAAAFTAVDECEHREAEAFAVNADGTRHVAEAARAVGAHLVHLSTDYVFDGTKAAPYVETDQPNPQSAYGRSKLAGEEEAGPDATIVRTSWVCGRHGANMVRTILRLAGQDERPLRFVDDQVGNPTFTASLAPVLLALGLDRAAGLWHVTNDETMSWFGFARAVLTAAGLDPDRVEPIATADLQPPRPAPRPANSALDNRALRDARRPGPGPGAAPLAALVGLVLTETRHLG